MGQTPIAAVVPVAFFTKAHIDMTEDFLLRLRDDLGRLAHIGVWHNIWAVDHFADDGDRMLRQFRIDLHHAPEWPFYKMWNAGAAWALEKDADVALFLNNDIQWPNGALRALAEALDSAPPDIAAASPDPASDFNPGELVDINATPAYRGLMGWCFAIRPTMWQQIDERYQCWYGDDELGLLLNEAGWRCVRAKGVPVQHPVNETTMQYREGLWEMRRADEALYNSKWVNA